MLRDSESRDDFTLNYTKNALLLISQLVAACIIRAITKATPYTCNIMASYPGFIIQRYIDAIQQHFKVTKAQICEQTGLQPALLEHNQAWFYPSDKHCHYLLRFANELGYFARYEMPDLTVYDGFMSGDQVTQNTAFSALRNAPTLGDFLRRFLVMAQAMPAHRHWIEKRHGQVRLYHDFNFKEEAFAAPQGLFYLLMIEIKMLFNIDDSKIKLNFSGAGLSDEVGFGRATKMAFDIHGSLSYLQFNLDVERVYNVYSNPMLDQNIARRFTSHFAVFEQKSSVRNQVEKIMQQGLLETNQMPTAEYIASLLNISKSTLYRRLAAEETSFAHIQQAVRSELAKQWLSQGNMSISFISDRLGFSCANAFTRAFKQSVGASPRDFRQGCR